MKPALALLGLDERVLAIGQRAVECNLPLSGIWAGDHNQALIASLRLGCCAFPDAAEPLSSAHWVVYSETGGDFPAGMQALDVRCLHIQGRRVSGPNLDPGWCQWLIELGFEPLPEG
ncbi:MAG: hypothetical protein KF760_25825 [Candidatus Eremiobacteraeota bacterium]|nr:hypothetical protein [Candidatus Eremiobacteraeota bacterium]